MLDIIAAGVLGVASHVKSKDWVRRKLRYTNIVEKPGLGLFVGAATAVVAAPVIAALPIIGMGTGVVVGIGLGAGVGTGISRGASQARSGWHPDDE
jgi:hypothetical protein